MTKFEKEFILAQSNVPPRPESDLIQPDFEKNLKIVELSSPTALFSLIKQKKWGQVTSRADAIPNEASTWIVEKNTDTSVRWKLLPIHQACEAHPTESAIKAIIRAFPRGVQIKDSGGDLPIHLACRERANVSVINTLLLQYPESAQVKDDEGRLPIHLACRKWAEVETISNLLIAYYHGAQCPDAYGLLPIHWACAQNASVGVVEVLLRAYPESVDIKDKWGRTPLALAQASSSPHRDDVITALQRDASYWTTELLNEVSTLKAELEKKLTAEKEISNKAETLESKLMEVTATSSAAAKSFRELKDALHAENIHLKSQVSTLTEQNEEQDHQIVELLSENTSYKAAHQDMSNRLAKLTEVLGYMEEQRHEIVKVAGEWEDTLKNAGDAVSVFEDVRLNQILIKD